MVSGHVRLFENDKAVRFYELGQLQIAQVVSEAHGFYDLDVDADDGKVSIVASAKNRMLTAKGKTLSEAVQRLVEMLEGKN